MPRYAHPEKPKSAQEHFEWKFLKKLEKAYQDTNDADIAAEAGYDYANVLHKNYKFFYAQMSGKLAGKIFFWHQTDFLILKIQSVSHFEI